MLTLLSAEEYEAAVAGAARARMAYPMESVLLSIRHRI
jgi:hypothetical protein